MLKQTDNFSNVKNEISSLCSSRIDTLVSKNSHIYLTTDDFSAKGLSSAGTKLDFPAQFLDKLNNDNHTNLANSI